MRFLVVLALCVATMPAFAKAPNGPRIERDYSPFMENLTVPEPPSFVSKRFAEQMTDPLPGFGGSSAPSGVHCCGIADCRFVIGHKKDDGHYEAVVPRGVFGNADEETVPIPDSAVIKNTPAGIRPPTSAVLCAAYYPTSTEPFTVYCFHPADMLGLWIAP